MLPIESSNTDVFSKTQEKLVITSIQHFDQRLLSYKITADKNFPVTQRWIKDQKNGLSTAGENQAFAQASVLSNKTF